MRIEWCVPIEWRSIVLPLAWAADNEPPQGRLASGSLALVQTECLSRELGGSGVTRPFTRTDHLQSQGAKRPSHGRGYRSLGDPVSRARNEALRLAFLVANPRDGRAGFNAN